jgi:phage-related protein (TIGR01555 family)
MRIVCEIYAEDITRAWRKHISSAQRWMQVEEQFEIRDLTEKAIFYAEAYGGAFIIPRYSESVVSGNDMARPRPVKKQGLLGFTVYTQYQLRPASQTTDLRQPNGLPMFYTIEGLPNVRIHHSWTYPLRGPSNVPSVHTAVDNQALLGQSRVDMIYDDFMRMLAAYDALSHILVKGNIDVLKLKGLAEALSNCSDTAEQQKIIEKMVFQASATITGANTFQPIVVDTEEALERKAGNHTGAADIVRELQTLFVGASRMPRSRLFGEQAKGLSNGGDAEMRAHYDRCASYRERRCTGLLNWVDAIAAPGIRSNWDYNPLWEMTAKEKIELDALQAGVDAQYAAMQVPGITDAIYARLKMQETYAALPDTMPQPQGVN